jgi:LysM repeat protein
MVNLLIARPILNIDNSKMSVSIVVAARNEEGNIKNILDRIPKMGPNDELIFDQYTALGKPGVYDALHSFNYRRSDKFGGYINDKVNAGLERIRQKGFKSDIKKLYIQVDPLTLTVYWFAIVGPSRDGFSYVRMDSRGSAGGYIRAVQKQLPRMHKLYPDLEPVKFLEFNENVIVCYTWDGKMLDNYCSMLNIQQHFFKYRKRYDDEKTLKSESILDVMFQEDLKQDTTKVQDIDSTTTQIKINNESKVIDQKVIPKKKPTTRYYKVKSGDTLSEIAEKYHTSVAKIKKTNNLRGDNLRIGQLLKIP